MSYARAGSPGRPASAARCRVAPARQASRHAAPRLLVGVYGRRRPSDRLSDAIGSARMSSQLSAIVLNPQQPFVGELDGLDGDFVAVGFEGRGPVHLTGKARSKVQSRLRSPLVSNMITVRVLRSGSPRRVFLNEFHSFSEMVKPCLSVMFPGLGAAGELEHGRVLAALQPLEDFSFCLDAGGLGEACNEVGFDLDPELVDGENVIKQRLPPPPPPPPPPAARGAAGAAGWRRVGTAYRRMKCLLMLEKFTIVVPPAPRT